MGGKDAFTALLAALDTTDAEASRAAALAVRQRIKTANARERSGYFAQVTKLLDVQAEQRQGLGQPGGRADGVGVEDPRLPGGSGGCPCCCLATPGMRAVTRLRAPGGDRGAAIHVGRRHGGAGRARAAGHRRERRAAAGAHGSVFAGQPGRAPRAGEAAGRDQRRAASRTALRCWPSSGWARCRIRRRGKSCRACCQRRQTARAPKPPRRPCPAIPRRCRGAGCGVARHDGSEPRRRAGQAAVAPRADDRHR